MTVIAAVFTVGAAPAASADTCSINFEPPAYATGRYQRSDGWSTTGDLRRGSRRRQRHGHASFGTRLCGCPTTITSGPFGDLTYSQLAPLTRPDEPPLSQRRPVDRDSAADLRRVVRLRSPQLTEQNDLYMSVSPTVATVLE